MANTENRGKTVREAVLEYCTYWTQAVYRDCWPGPDEEAPDAITEEMKAARLAVVREMMAMLRHEILEQDDKASASEPMREPAVLEITGDFGSDSEPEIKAGSFLGTYGKLDIDTAGHWTYRAGETRLREIPENGPDWFIHYDQFFVTHEDGPKQTLTFTLSRRRNDEVNETTAFPTVGDRVPANPGQFEEPAPVHLWVEGKPGDGMPRREATQDELRHLRFYPERDELSGGGLKFEGLLFFNAAERLPVDETKGSDKAADDPKERLDTQAAEAASTPTKADQAQTGDDLKDWFVNIYVPAHKDDSPNPTRKAALSAASPKFANYCGRTHLRNDLRKIWRTHAPPEWKRKGPRAKTE